MHGQFYQHQHYLPQTGVTQNAVSNAGARVPDLAQQAQLQFQTQHPGMINGQSFQTHGAQQPQQQRLQQMQHATDQLTHQQYVQLLQNPSYQQALYNQALQQQQQQQQNQTLQNRQEQQRLLQQRQSAVNDQSLRAILRHQYAGDHLSQMHHLTFSQLAALGQSPHRFANLQQHQAAAAVAAKNPTLPQPYHDDIARVLQGQQQQRVHQDEAAALRSRQQHVLRTIPTQNSPAQDVLRQDILNNPRLPSPTAPGRSPPGFAPNANIYSNVILSPQGGSGLISPHGNPAFSPGMGHLSNISGTRVRPTAVQMTSRTDISTVQTQELPMQGNYQAPPSRTVNQDIQSPTRIMTDAVDAKTTIHVKRQTPSVNTCSAPVVIVDSEGDDDDHHQQAPSTSCSGRKESKEESSARTDFTPIVIDDDIEITGVKEAEVMFHMRPDCPIHIFQRVDDVTTGPKPQNVLKCGKCYCYVCDKLANECKEWSALMKPHCNAHPKASCWKARRSTKRSPLMMKLSSDEVTPELAEAGDIALQFMIQIREAYITYRNGIPCEYDKVPCNCQCHRSPRGHEPCISCKVIHDVKKRFNYQPVREIAMAIIREIQTKYSRDRPEMAVIMLEAILSELCSQRPADFNHTLRMPSNPDKRCQCDFPQIVEEFIEKELMDILTRHELSVSFRNNLIKCVEEAIKLLQLKEIMKKFLNMRHWDNLLLRAVLTGTNTSGSKGREVLRETMDVIKLRVEKLDREKRFQRILRYLKTVKILQAPNSKISHNQFMALLEQWMLLYEAKQGHFKNVALRLTEPIPTEQPQRPSPLLLSTFQPDFLIQLLDSLAGKDAQQTTRLDSFDQKNSNGPHIIVGKDADVLLLLFHFILQQNRSAAAYVPLYIWLADWVNRTPLPLCLDPVRIKPWRDQGTRIIETSLQAYYQGQCQMYLLQCMVHDPYVHLFNASINIVSAASKFPSQTFQPEHLTAIMAAFKNNEWALFLLVTQSPMMNFHNAGILRWITNYCQANNGSLAQIKERVILDSIQPYDLEDVTNFVKALVKPDWMNSIKSIQRTALSVTSEYATRLFDEMKRCDKKVLMPKEKWLEDIVLKYLDDKRLLVNLMSDEVIANCLKNISKVCSFLNPVKRNIELYRKISPNTEWMRRCNALEQYLSEKFAKDKMALTMEEFSSLLWLLWSIGDVEKLGTYFLHFQERHSCATDVQKVTSAKVIQEVAHLLDSMPAQELRAIKRSLVEKCRRLCVVETLSWLTCTECATKMSSAWTKIWVSIAKANLKDGIQLLNLAVLDQFKAWLNKIAVDSPENYKRLLGCLELFLKTLVSTWKLCSISYEEAGRLLTDVAIVVQQPNLKSDILRMSSAIIQTELDKLKPKVPEFPEPPPATSNHLIQRQTSNAQRIVADLRTQRLTNDIQAPAAPTANTRHVPQPHTQPPPTSVTMATHQLNHQRTIPPSPQGVTKEPEPQTVKPPPKQPARNADPPTKREVPAKSQAVMSPDSLFKKKSQHTVALTTQKVAPEKQSPVPKLPAKDQTPFSPVNTTRTKKCQNCSATISCASFRCPKCNQASRSVQPVTCPQCHQENKELKGYACQFCYRSLLDVLFGGGEQPATTSENPKSEVPQRKKKKSTDKRRNKVKSGEKANVTVTTAAKNSVTTATDVPKIVPERKIVHSNEPLTQLARATKKNSNLSEESSDSSSDDFVLEKPSKKRKRENSSPGKVPPLKLKRKPSGPSHPPPPIAPPPQTSHGASLTDSDSDSDTNQKTAMIITHEEKNDCIRKMSEKCKFSPVRHNAEHPSVPFSPPRAPHERPEIPKQPAPRVPNSFNKPKIMSTENIPVPAKAVNSTHNSSAVSHNAPAKRGVGHCSTMTKKQKNLLSRFKKVGTGSSKFPPKVTPPNPRPPGKDLLKSPPAGSHKRFPLDNGLMPSPGRNNQLQERQRHDSGCSSGSVGSTSGLSFGLAKVAEKGHKNVGHRTGGPPGSGKKSHVHQKPSNNVSAQSSSNAENPKRTLFPQPLNNSDPNQNHGKKKNKRKKKELMKKIPRNPPRHSLVQQLNSLLARRKPGPASHTNYRKILKIEHKLKKSQRRLWSIPQSVKIPSGVDISLFAEVSLSLFPRDKLLRIQNLVPHHRLKVLFA